MVVVLVLLNRLLNCDEVRVRVSLYFCSSGFIDCSGKQSETCEIFNKTDKNLTIVSKGAGRACLLVRRKKAL